MILRTLSVDYGEISKLCHKLEKVLSQGKRVTVTSPGGTSLTLLIKNHAPSQMPEIFLNRRQYG